MKIQGKIIDISLDYLMHKPKITIQLNNQESILNDEFNKLYEEELIDIEISKHKEKRSLNANSYCWVLMQKIADNIGSTKEEVYRKYIKEKGVFRTITIDNQAASTFIHLWTSRGLGWICEVLNKGNTTTDLIAYYGSSSYNTKQMSIFVDYIVEEAKELGIETLSPDELNRLKSLWNVSNSK